MRTSHFLGVRVVYHSIPVRTLLRWPIINTPSGFTFYSYLPRLFFGGGAISLFYGGKQVASGLFITYTDTQGSYKSVVGFYGKLRTSAFQWSYSQPKILSWRWDRDKYERWGCPSWGRCISGTTRILAKLMLQNHDPNCDLCSDMKIRIFPSSRSAETSPPVQYSTFWGPVFAQLCLASNLLLSAIDRSLESWSP